MERRQGERSRRDAVNLQAAEWVVRQALGRLDAADRAALDAWLRQDPAHEVAFERESLAWERTERLRTLRPAGAAIDDDGLDLIAPPARRRASPWREPWRIAAAAALCLAVGGAAVLWGGGGVAYATAVGERRVVVLNDGSRLELNTDTKVQVRLTPTGRRVKLLRGEALFDVRPDKRRPFTVQVDRDVVRAVGTAFSVRLDRAAVKVLVVEGEVEVNGQAGGSPFTARLPAGRLGAYGAQGIETRAAAPGEAARTLSWRYGAIELAGETLDEAAAEFNRYNLKQLVVADRAAGALRLGGYFQQSDVEGFARALRSSFDVQVTDTGRAITIASPQGASKAPRAAVAGPRRGAS
jgi:transmembrane sensor